MFSDGFCLQNWEIEKMIEMVRNNQIESIKEVSREAGRNAGIEESRKQTLIIQ